MRFKVGDVVATHDDICFVDWMDDLWITDAMQAELDRVTRVVSAARGRKYDFYKLAGSKYWWPDTMLYKVGQGDDHDEGRA